MCRSCSRELRCSGFGLNSYLSSGKSSAMAVSLRPISFHVSRTACVGLTGGLGAALFFSCDPTGSTANPVAKTRPAITLHFFISSPLRFAPIGSGRSSLQTDHRASRFQASGLHLAGVPWGSILRRKRLRVTGNSKRPDVLDLMFTSWGFPFELGLFAFAHRLRFGHFA